MKNIEAKTLIQGPPLVDNPGLIKVRTINPKIVEQMPWLDGEAGYMEKKPDLNGVQILGTITKGCCLVVLLPNGNVNRLRGLSYLEYLMEMMSNADANAQMKNLPQLFEV